MLYITGKMFRFVGNEIRLSLSRISYKTSVCMLARNALLWVLYHKKKCFCFFVAKTRRTQLYSTKSMFWFVCYNIGLFSVLLHQKRFSPSMQGVTLIFTWFYSNNGFPSFTLSQNRLSEDKLVLCFHNQTTLWTLYITEKMFWFVGNWIRLS